MSFHWNSGSAPLCMPFIFHMPPWWPMYIFWGLNNSSFRAGYFLLIPIKLVLTGFCSSSKQPNLQPKNGNYVVVLKIFFVYFFCLPYMTMAVSPKGTRRQPLVFFYKGGINTLKQSWGAQHAKAFSTLKNFTKVAALAADSGFS